MEFTLIYGRKSLKRRRKTKGGKTPSLIYTWMYVTSFHHLHKTSVTNDQRQSIPLSLRAMFDQYFQLGHRLRRHYLSPSVILCLVSGKFVPPIHRRNLYSMQYSMLPANRAGMMEVWSWLTEKKTNHSGSNHSMNPGIKVPPGFASGGGRRSYR